MLHRHRLDKIEEASEGGFPNHAWSYRSCQSQAGVSFFTLLADDANGAHDSTTKSM